MAASEDRLATPVVLVGHAGPVATVTLNRPEVRNAIDTSLLETLNRVLVELDANGDVRAVVLTGADPAFCAGVDLAEMARTGHLPRGALEPGRPWPSLRTPVVGAVNGPAYTGGLEMALHCDFLVASPRARFADTHARVGVMPAWGMSVHLPRAVGWRRAVEMSLTGNPMDAEEALRCGLANRVVPHDELLDVARALAADIARIDRASVEEYLASYRSNALMSVEDGLASERVLARSWLRRRRLAGGGQPRSAPEPAPVTRHGSGWRRGPPKGA